MTQNFLSVPLFFIILLIHSCSGKVQSEDRVVHQNSTTKWKEHSSIDDIPEILKDKLSSIVSGFTLANPDEPFQAGCGGFEGEELPQRQLRYLANNRNSWYLAYKHGGVGLHYHYLECEIIDSTIEIVETGVTLFDLESREEIIEMKQSEGLLPRDVYLSSEIDKL